MAYIGYNFIDRPAKVLFDYNTPGNAATLSGRTNIKRIYGVHDDTKVRHFLATVPAYQLHMQTKRPNPYNYYATYLPRTLLQLDLVDISKYKNKSLSQQNAGTRFLLTGTDGFTRRLFVRPMKSKSMISTLAAIKSMMEEVGTIKHVMFDEGKEFVNSAVTKFFTDNSVTINHPRNTTVKASLVEIANKGLQSLIYKWMTASKSNKYIHKLDDIVKSINARVNRSLGVSPTMIEEEPEKYLSIARSNLNKHYTDVFRRGKRIKHRFKVGDTVRMALKTGRFGRSYKKGFSDTLYKVVFVDTRQSVPMFRLKNLSTGHVENRDFYQNYLTLVRSENEAAEQADEAV